MKIVNVYKESDGDNHKYQVQFEAELYHTGINPKISFFKNNSGEICLTFKNWDTQEAIDSLTSDQAEEVLMTLVEAINFARHYELDNNTPSLFDELGDINAKPPEQGQ